MYCGSWNVQDVSGVFEKTKTLLCRDCDKQSPPDDQD
jgi:hypothetical protein